jgi:acyl carrier protein
MFREVATALTERDYTAIARDDTIAEAGIDSLAMLEIVGALEERLGLRVAEERLAGIRTVGEFLQVIAALQASGHKS